MGLTPEEQTRVANLLNCKVGSFPMTYLGLPIADKKDTISDMESLVGQVGHRLDPWQGRLMSSAARLTLTNSSLASLPIYTMSLFLMAEGTHAGFDKHMSRFFWEGVGEKIKYHWVNWPTVCQPKDQGGLGIINSRLLNIAVLTKWIWRMFTEENNDLLELRIIKAKYPGAANIFNSSPLGGSPF